MKRLAVLAIAGLFAATTATAEELRIGTSADFPPWETLDENNQIVGFDRDFGDELCRRIQANCTWNNASYDTLLPTLQQGGFDAVIAGVSVTFERAAMVNFTSAYADAPNSVVVRSDAVMDGLETREALQAALTGKTIGVQTGTTHETVIKEHFYGATLRVYDKPDEIVSDLLAGRIDAAMMETSVIDPLIEGAHKGKISYLGPLLKGADFAEFGLGQGVALAKSRGDDLQSRMNKAIADMLADGTMGALSEKWFGYDLSAS